MKILNEKGVIHFAHSGVPADKEGYLHKKGEVNKGFQKRWFVLKGNLLFYYEKKGEKDPIGVIILEGCTIELAEDSDNFMFLIKYSSSSSSARTYCLSSHSQQSMESWMKALSCAGYEYIKLVVTELQSKLEELSNTAETDLVEAAFRDSQVLGMVYQDSGVIGNNSNSLSRSSSHHSNSKMSSSFSADGHKRINPFDSMDDEDCDEMHPGDAYRPTTQVSTAEIVTWQILQVTKFEEMHKFMRQQIIDFSTGGGEGTED